MLEGLAQRLRRETRDLHVQAERAGVMRALLRGEISRENYIRLLISLYRIYGVLESGLVKNATRPLIDPIYFPALFRHASLERDLAILGQNANTPAHEAQVASEYILRLEEIARSEPDLLGAHAYVRYLGDLSGGQALRKIVVRFLPEGEKRATHFYDFGSPAEVSESAEAFRRGLNSLPCDQNQADRIVAEALYAFELHTRLFEELAAP